MIIILYETVNESTFSHYPALCSRCLPVTIALLSFLLFRTDIIMLLNCGANKTGKYDYTV